MTSLFGPLRDDDPAVLRSLPMLRLERAGTVLHVRLDRPEKRNAIGAELLAQLHTAWVNLPEDVRVVVLSGAGEHFCAGLDVAEGGPHGVAEGIAHSRSWNACLDAIQHGPVPVIAVLHGAVVGGGLALAAAAHLRVAEKTSFYGLPAGPRGIFAGGGGSVRVPRLIGVARVTDMMLTGRVFDAEEGQAFAISNYLVDEGEGLPRALALAHRIAANAPLANFAVRQALPRIAELPPADGLFVESLVASIAASDDATPQRVRASLETRDAKVGGSS